MNNSNDFGQAAVADPVDLVVDEVTGSRSLNVSGIDGHRTASDVANSLAAMMELPRNTPFALRDNDTARMIRDDVALGSQIPQRGSRLTLVPKSHLG